MENKKSMNVESIKIENLFEIFNYDIHYPSQLPGIETEEAGSPVGVADPCITGSQDRGRPAPLEIHMSSSLEWLCLHAIRLLGGILFLSGMFIMAWNSFKTLTQGKAPEFAAAEPAIWGEHA